MPVALVAVLDALRFHLYWCCCCRSLVPDNHRNNRGLKTKLILQMSLLGLNNEIFLHMLTLPPTSPLICSI